MAYLIAMLVSVALFGGFLLLTRIETARGSRFFEAQRSRMDLSARKFEFIVQHVDWGALITHASRSWLEALTHTAAQKLLQAVRAMERFLARAVHLLSTRQQGAIRQREPATPSKAAMNVERLKHGLRSKSVRVKQHDGMAQQEVRGHADRVV